MKKYFKVIPAIIVITLLFAGQAKALTYQEILQSQKGKILAGNITTVPSGLKYQCNASGNQVTLTWNSVSGADRYLFRLNDPSNDTATTTQWGWYTPGTTDVNNDNVIPTTYTSAVLPGKNYTWWVHGYFNSTSIASEAVFSTFNCNSAPPTTPTGLSYTCNSAGNQVTVSWNSASGAEYYLLRINDTTDTSAVTQWGWYSAGTTDVNNDNVTQTTYTTAVVAGHNYVWWVHSQAGYVSSDPAYGGFTCTNQQAVQTNINVKDYGAKGDGIVDDAPAIQAAIEKAGAGTTIYIPSGIYMLGTSAGSPSNFSNGKPMQTALWLKASKAIIKGDGGSTVLKLMPSKKMRILTLTGDNSVVDSITADGNKSQRNGTVGYPDGDVVDGLIVGEAYRQYITVKNCEIRNGIETGVGFWQNNYATVENCYNHGNGTLSAGGSGIDLSGGIGNKAINNRLIGNTYGIWSSFGSNGTEIRNNVIQNNDRSGLALGGSDPGGNDKNFVIDGNTISGNGKDGFAAVGVSYVQGGTFSNNKVIDNIFDGFQIYDTVEGKNSTNWTIQNNICSNTGSNTSQMFGMRVIGAAKNISIKNNTCQNNGKSLADQIVIDQKAQVNSDWQTVNTLSFGSTPAVTTNIVTPTPTPTPTPAPIIVLSPAPLPPVTTTYPYPSSSLVNDSGTIYFICGKNKIPFTNWQAFVGLGYSLRNVVKGDLSAYAPSTSYLITTSSAQHPWCSWLLYNNTIYYSTEKGMIGVPNADLFLKNGGSWNYVVKMNQHDIGILNSNKFMPVLAGDDERIYNHPIVELGLPPTIALPSPSPTPIPAPTSTLIIPSPTPTASISTSTILGLTASQSEIIKKDLQTIKSLGFKRIRIITYVRYPNDSFYTTWPSNVFITFPKPKDSELANLKQYLQLVDQAGLQYEFVLLMMDSKNKYYTNGITGQDYKNFVDAIWPAMWTGKLDSILVGGDLTLNPSTIDTQNPDSFPTGKNVVESHRQWLLEMWPYMNSKCPGCNIGIELLTGYAKFWDAGVGSLIWVKSNLSPLPKFVGVQYYPTTPTALTSLGFKQGTTINWDASVKDWYENLKVAAGGIPILADEIGLDLNLGFTQEEQTNFYKVTTSYLAQNGVHFNVWEFADHPGIGILGLMDTSRILKPSATAIQNVLIPTLSAAFTAGVQYNPPESVGWQFMMPQQ